MVQANPKIFLLSIYESSFEKGNTYKLLSANFSLVSFVFLLEWHAHAPNSRSGHLRLAVRKKQTSTQTRTSEAQTRCLRKIEKTEEKTRQKENIR